MSEDTETALRGRQIRPSHSTDRKAGLANGLGLSLIKMVPRPRRSLVLPRAWQCEVLDKNHSGGEGRDGGDSIHRVWWCPRHRQAELAGLELPCPIFELSVPIWESELAE